MIVLLVCKRAENRETKGGKVWYCTTGHHRHGARHTELVCRAPWRVLECTVAGGRPLSPVSSSSGCLWAFSFSLFHIEGHGYFGLSSFIKGSGVSESLWCFLSRGGSTLLQRVHEGERMYPPLAIIGWWEPAGKNKIRCMTLRRINTETEKSHVKSCAVTYEPTLYNL